MPDDQCASRFGTSRCHKLPGHPGKHHDVLTGDEWETGQRREDLAPAQRVDLCCATYRPPHAPEDTYVCELPKDHYEHHRCFVGTVNEYQWGPFRLVPEPAPPVERPGNHGQYDTASPYEPVKVIEHYDLNFALGNVVKYVLRAGKKAGVDDIEDLEKARTYIELEILRRRRLRTT